MEDLGFLANEKDVDDDTKRIIQEIEEIDEADLTRAEDEGMVLRPCE